MRKIWILAAMAVGGCAAQGASQPVSPAAATPAADLPVLARTVAAQLGAADAGALAAVELELRRISDALPAAAVQTAALAPPPAPVQPAPQPAPEAQPQPGYDAPPDLEQARSLYSALTLGAYPNIDTARAAWFGMNAAHGEALSGLAARMEPVDREGRAPAFLLKAGPFQTAQEAEGLCVRLREAGAVCSAGDFTGEPL